MRHILPALLLIGCLGKAASAKETFPVLSAGGVTYSNVVVTDKTATDVFIRHARGIATLKVSDLNSADLSRLGYPLPGTESAKAMAPITTTGMAQTRPVRTIFDAIARIGGSSQTNPIHSWMMMAILLPLVALYLVFCRCCQHMCRRCGEPSSFLIWLPLLKRLPLFKAVGMSRWWVLVGVLVPFVGWFSWVYCCLRLCEMFNRSKWLALPMISPVFQWAAFIYLARVTKAEDNEPALRMCAGAS